MPGEPEYPGVGPIYDRLNPENNPGIRDARERENNTFYKEVKHMNQRKPWLVLT